MASLTETTVKLTLVLLCSPFVMPNALLAPAADPHQADEAPVNEQPATNTPRLMSRPENYTLYEGEEALLSCKIHDIGPFGTIWQINKDTLLFAGSLRLSHNKKYDLLADNTLKISNISKTEAGVYNCTLSTQEPQSVVYHVRVKDGVRKPIPPKQHSHQSSPTSGHPNCQILPTTLLTSLFISLLWANFPFYSLATGTSNRPSMLL